MKNEVKFDFDDILIVPSVITDVNSRSSEINVYDENGFLPLFTAPMDTVIDEDNFHIFKDNKIYPIIPRTVTSQSGFSGRKYMDDFKAYKFGDNHCFKTLPSDKSKALFDMANGHMRKLLDAVKMYKDKYGDDLTLMVGNIANPKTYELLSEAGADYIRCGVGNGGGCLTTEQTGIGYPMGSLISECYEVAQSLRRPAKIVADGGFKKYADIIKAIALGADYVMLGSIFNKALESCGETYKQNIKHENWTEPGEQVDQYCPKTKELFLNGTKYFKKFRGMSTKEVQRAMGNKVIKTSEGITRMNQVEYTLEGWVENFTHYLRTAMSYHGAFNLEEFRGNTEIIRITENAFKRYNK